MCRLLAFKSKSKESSAYLSDLVLKPSHGIITQSYGCTERYTAGAGTCTLLQDAGVSG